MGSEQAPQARGEAPSISRMASHVLEPPERGYRREGHRRIFGEDFRGSE
jgi:hypothetical protein